MVLKKFLFRSVLSGLAFAALAHAQTAVGTSITYQGRLEEAGLIADGTFDFQFRLFDAFTAGAQVGSTLSVNDLAVVDGVFTANIDFGTAAFTTSARWVEIAVRDGASVGAYTTLTPRQRIRATPVAIQSLKDANWSVTGSDISNTNTGDVGIGTASPLGRLHVSDTSNPNMTFENTGDTTAARDVRMNFRHSNGIGVEIEAQRDSGMANGMSLAFRTQPASGSIAERMRITEDGDVGIGSTSPNARLHVRTVGTTPFTPDITLRVTSEFPSTISNTTEFMDFAGNQIIAVKDNVFSTLKLQPNSGEVAIGNGSLSAAKLTVTRAAVSNLFNSDLSLDDVVIQDADNAWLGLYSDPTGNVGSGITFGESSGIAAEPKWAIYARTSDNVGDLNITFGTDTNPTSNEKMLQVDRDGTTKVKVLEILGADVSERFPTSDCVEPGNVVMIDAANPGQLCLAKGEYNTKVAGIVSGAGDIPVGAILGNMPGKEEAPPIALSGRVWTQCDATDAAIEAGDLLTTSNTPGHAMKAADADRRGGAVIGKAMSSLAKGQKGLVLVLVNLQ